MKFWLNIIFLFFVSLSLAQLPPSLVENYNNQIEQAIQLSLPAMPIQNTSMIMQKRGSPAKDIIDRQNSQTTQMMNYEILEIPSNPYEVHQFVLNEYNRALANKKYKQLKEVTEALSDIHKENKYNNPDPAYFKSADFANLTKPYYSAFNKLKEQLTGTRPLSVKDAYFEVEKAWGDVFLNKKEFDETIKKSVAFIKQWMIENNLNPKDNLALHLSIQKFMSDTLTIGNKKNPEMPLVLPTAHFPFYYDNQDFNAEKDYRSYHVTKAFATGNGQCHTLPLIYTSLAEAMGATFYLSHAPMHSFVKYPDNEGNIHNYEPTTNWLISDQWYKDHSYVKSLAEKNKIYLEQMDRKQIVAGAIIDLAYSYKRKLGFVDGAFINQCVDFAMNYFPNKEANISGWLLRSQVTAAKLDRLLAKNKVTTFAEAETMPEAVILMRQLDAIHQKIEMLGYAEIPEAAYDSMLQATDNKGKVQKGKIDNLKKRNLFIPLNKQ